MDPRLDLDPFLRAFRIDTAGGDRTSELTVDPLHRLHTELVSREPMIIAAGELIERLPQALNLDIDAQQVCSDGSALTGGGVIGTLAGNTRDVLALERTLLNALQLLCGIATTTHQWSTALPSGVTLLDTRKTHAGLRAWERLAVRCGGGANHRFNLADTIMIKDNHIAACGDLAGAVQRAVGAAGHAVKVICEVETLDDAHAAVAAGAHGLLVDNVPASRWPEFWTALPEQITLEFSGGVVFDTLSELTPPPRPVFVSTSQTVMAARPVDIGLDVVSAPR